MNKSLSVFFSLIMVVTLKSLSAYPALDPGGAGQQPENRILTLQEAVHMALARSPEVLIAEAQAARTRESERETRSLNRPQVMTGTGYAYNNGFPVGTPSIFQITGSQSIFNKKNSNLIKEAEEAGKSSAFGAEAARNEVASKTALIYYQLHLSRKMIEIAMAWLDSTRKQKEEVGILLEAGRVTQVEAAQADNAVRHAHQQLNAAQEQAKLAEADLRRFTGFSETASIKTVEPVIENPIFDTPADTIYLQALECTPEIKKLKADLKAKEFHVEAEKAERLPKAEIESQYAVFSNTNNYADYYKNFSRSNVVLGLSIQIPIFDGSRTSSRVAQSRQEVSEARIRLDGQIADLRMSIERGLSDLRVAQEASQVAQDDAELARKTVQANETLQEGGRISPKEMEGFRSILQQKELASLQADQVLFQRKLELLGVAGSISSALQ